MATERTAIHRYVERRLDELGLAYESEFPDFEPYKLDIYMSEFYAFIEVDGPGHTRGRDSKRDKFLQDTYNLRGLHLGMSGIRRHHFTAEGIKGTIVAFVEQVAPTADRRRSEYLERLQHHPVELKREAQEERIARLKRMALRESLP